MKVYHHYIFSKSHVENLCLNSNNILAVSFSLYFLFNILCPFQYFLSFFMFVFILIFLLLLALGLIADRDRYLRDTCFQVKYKNSRSLMFFKIGVLKNFALFTGRHLCWSLFLIKLQA